MGVWLVHVGATSSDWEELRTLLQMREYLVKRKDDPIRSMTVFYFTDKVYRSPERILQFGLARPHRTDQDRGTAVGLLTRGYPYPWNRHDRSGHGGSQSRRLGQSSPQEGESSPHHRPSI
jgi:hypothetical protein